MAPDLPPLRHPVDIPPRGSLLERMVAAAQRDPAGFELSAEAAELAAEVGLEESQARLFFKHYAYLLLLRNPPIKY